MNGVFKSAVIFFGVFFAVSAVSYAADAAKKSNYDKYGKPLPGTQTVIRPPLQAAAPQPAAEGNALVRPSVTPDVPQCRDFEYAGDVILPHNAGNDYLCPPGYECKGVVGGFQCRWRNLSSLPAASPECRMVSCAETQFGKAIEDIYGQ